MREEAIQFVHSMYPPLYSVITLDDTQFTMSCTKDKPQTRFDRRRARNHGTRVDCSVSPLYRLCIRTIIKGLRDDAGDKWDLSLLPPSVRNDLYQWNMTLSNGFAKEIHFLNLLPAHESIIKLNHTVVTDAMLDLIANRVVVELQIVSSRQEFSRKSLMDCISRMPQLERLVLCECDAVDDAFITMLSQYCLHLKHMVLEKCMNITDGCADALSKMRLRELDLSKSKVTDQLIKDLEHSDLMQNHLVDISFRNCNMTNNSLQYLNWGKLENLNIIGTRIEDMTCIPENAVFKTLNWSL